ncbi:unnamed protein product [Schistosoma rodhaini]|uniref:ATP-grasp domain-containing protein n=1 Tax=Schistosoma rodhaini TaxID=6188 RepID=A0AA85G5X5_9TREM|nr:unnamed protein product [Schistosoma rodhaini]
MNTGMITYLKRRFSSGDLQGELADKRMQEGLPSFLRFGSSTQSGQSHQQYHQQSSNIQTTEHSYSNQPQDFSSTGPANYDMRYGSTAPTMAEQFSSSQTATTAANHIPGSVGRGRGAYPSAPTSPTRGMGLGASLMGPMGSLTGQISNTLMRSFNTAASTAQNISGKISSKEHQKILLVIDDTQTDWCKYFRGKKLMGDWEIKVEQAQFSEISLTAYSEQGCVVSIYPDQIRSKPLKSFKPDFVLVRQHPSDLKENWQPILTGLMYGGTPCMNTLHAIYNMKNRPWLFAHLLMIRNRLGKENFPLISQTYHTSYKEMAVAPAFPVIVKVGVGHRGEGKVKADTPFIYQDLVSLMISGQTYATTEPFIDANCDLHVQKIGTNYKAFMRKAISGNWKSNTGSALLEKVPMNDKFKLWIDEVSRLFGGLDICSIDALQSRSGEYFIYEANGSDMTLYGDSQESDRTEIAELVIQRMQSITYSSSIPKVPSLQTIGRTSETERPVGIGVGNATPLAQPSIGHSAVHPAFNPPSQQLSSQPYSQVHQSQPTNAQQILQPQSTQKYPPSTGITSNTSSLIGEPMGSVSPALSKHSDPGFVTSFGSSTSSLSSRADTPHQTTFSTPATTAASRGYSTTSENPDIGYRSNIGGLSSVQNTTHTNYSSHTWNQSSSSGLFSPSKIPPMDSTTKPNLMNQQPSTGFDASDHTTGTKIISSPQQSFGSSFSSNVPYSTEKLGNDVSRKPTSQTTSGPDRPDVPPRQTSLRTGPSTEDTDDTMKNLRKTFAGIFGDL